MTAEYGEFSHDAIAKLPDDLRREVEEALLDPGLTYEAVWHRHGLDDPTAAAFIPRSTFCRNGKDRRDYWASLQREAALRSIRLRRQEIERIEQEMGSLGSQAADIMRHNLIVDLAADGCSGKELEQRSRIMLNQARALATIQADQRGQEQWEGKRREAQAAVERAQETAKLDPKQAYERLREDVQRIYGIGEQQAA